MAKPLSLVISGAEIPAHTPHDNVAWIVSPFERIGCGDGHVSPYQIGTQFFATERSTWAAVLPQRAGLCLSEPRTIPGSGRSIHGRGSYFGKRRWKQVGTPAR